MVAEYGKSKNQEANRKTNMAHGGGHAPCRYLLIVSILVPVLVLLLNVAMHFENGAMGLNTGHSGVSASLNDVMSGLHWR